LKKKTLTCVLVFILIVPELSVLLPKARATSDPTIVEVGVSFEDVDEPMATPLTMTPEGHVRLWYNTSNPNSSPMNVILGATIEIGSTTYNDPAHDESVSIISGTYWSSREFYVPADVSSGSYTVIFAIWASDWSRQYDSKSEPSYLNMVSYVTVDLASIPSNAGTITWDSSICSLPTTIHTTTKQHGATANPPSGFTFNTWESGDSVSFDSEDRQTVNVYVHGSGALTVEYNSPPITIYNGYVTPTSGTESTTFSYYVSYYDPRGLTPTTTELCIGTSNWYTMTLCSGSASDGIYQYSTTLSVGTHSFSFMFSDGSNTIHLPWSGTNPGPNVLPDFTLLADPPSLSIDQGNNAIVTVSMQTADGYSYPVSLSASVYGQQVWWLTTTFNPLQITTAIQSTMNVQVAYDVNPGTYPVTITGTGLDPQQKTFELTFSMTITQLHFTDDRRLSVSPPASYSAQVFGSTVSISFYKIVPAASHDDYRLALNQHFGVSLSGDFQTEAMFLIELYGLHDLVNYLSQQLWSSWTITSDLAAYIGNQQEADGAIRVGVVWRDSIDFQQLATSVACTIKQLTKLLDEGLSVARLVTILQELSNVFASVPIEFGIYRVFLDSPQDTYSMLYLSTVALADWAQQASDILGKLGTIKEEIDIALDLVTLLTSIVDPSALPMWVFEHCVSMVDTVVSYYSASIPETIVNAVHIIATWADPPEVSAETQILSQSGDLLLGWNSTDGSFVDYSPAGFVMRDSQTQIIFLRKIDPVTVAISAFGNENANIPYSLSIVDAYGNQSYASSGVLATNQSACIGMTFDENVTAFENHLGIFTTISDTTPEQSEPVLLTFSVYDEAGPRDDATVTLLVDNLTLLTANNLNHGQYEVELGTSNLIGLTYVVVYASITNMTSAYDALQLTVAELKPGHIYINPDGSITPNDGNITTNDETTYTLAQEITGSIIVRRSNVILDGAYYTLQGDADCGISLNSVSDVELRNIIAVGYGVGVKVDSCSDITISECSFVNSGNNGVSLSYSSNVTVSLCNMTGAFDGTVIDDCSNITISASEIAMNDHDGVAIYTSGNITIFANTLTSNGNDGIYLFEWLRYRPYYTLCCTFVDNYLSTNGQNGVEVDLYSESDITFSGNNIAGNVNGIYLNYHSGDFFGSGNTIIDGNNLTANSNAGVYVNQLFYWLPFRYDTISNNSLIGNGLGICIIAPQNTLPENVFSTVTGNIIAANQVGILLQSGWGALLCGNFFINNTVQAQDYFGTHNWDNGYPEGGNYWSDYTGIDTYSGPNQDQPGSDGIGDTPYTIGGLTDNYPLMENPLPVPYVGETIYICSDGSISPSVAPILREGDLYILTGDINLYSVGDGIVIQRDNVTLDGEGHTVHGLSASDSKGIYLNGRVNVNIRNIRIVAFYYGVYADSSSGCSFSGDSTANNEHGFELDSSSNDAFWENSVANNAVGVDLNYCSNCTFSENNIANNGIGIWLDSSSYDNSISGNNLTANNGAGIGLYSSSDNSVSGNEIANNGDGIYLHFSSNNNVSGNNLTANNNYAICLDSSSNNTIYHNNFMNNTSQAYSSGSTNVWDDGYPSGGNYWNDYNGMDFCKGQYQNVTGSDGIGDTPYIIDASNQDNYPLMNPYPTHEVVAVGAVVAPSEVCQGYGCAIEVSVANAGDFAEVFNLTIYANMTDTGNVTAIHTFENVTLNSRDSTTLTFMWDTTGFDIGNYTISAYATPVPGEINVADNTFVAGTVQIIQGMTGGGGGRMPYMN
jgi:parallel beta-helix repeat protein